MKKLNRAQYLNYLAIEFLENLGNKTPSQAQIDLMESLISQMTTTFIGTKHNHKQYQHWSQQLLRREYSHEH